MSDLVAYSQDFGAFLQSASPRLPKQVVADLVKHHVVTLKTVVDAQSAKDPAKAFRGVRTAAAHMQMIADPLAETIVKQFPDRFMAELQQRTPTTAVSRGAPHEPGRLSPRVHLRLSP